MNRKTLYISVPLAVAVGILLALLQRWRTPDPGNTRAHQPSPRTAAANNRAIAAEKGGRPTSVPNLRTERRRPPTALELQDRNITLAQSYNAEPRDPTWAPAMESSLHSRFESALPDWLKKISVSDVECRTSTCRLVTNYPSALMTTSLERAAAEGLPPTSPIEHLVLESGPLAGGTSVLKSETVVGPDGVEQQQITWVLGFSPNEFEPASYSTWVESRKGESEKTRERLVAFWRKLATNKAEAEKARQRFETYWQLSSKH
jgi:hypothetical protein